MTIKPRRFELVVEMSVSELAVVLVGAMNNMTPEPGRTADELVESLPDGTREAYCRAAEAAIKWFASRMNTASKTH